MGTISRTSSTDSVKSGSSLMTTKCRKSLNKPSSKSQEGAKINPLVAALSISVKTKSAKWL